MRDVRLTIWLRSDDQGWQRTIVTVREQDSVHISDHGDQQLLLAVIEMGKVPNPFDPSTLSTDQLVLVGGG